ncbi:MAG: hypothetical protein ABIQ74_11410, partial [Chitinophagales bacterium]
MPRILFLFSFIIFQITAIYAQSDKSFPDDRPSFLKSITDLLNETKRDDAKQTAADLEKTWPAISSARQGDIIEIAQAMRARKMLTSPYFQKYFNSILAFQASKQDDYLWDQWKSITLSVISNLRQGNNKKYEDWLDFSLALFTEHALYISQGKTWKFDADDFDLLLENNIPVLKFSEGTILGITEGDSIRVEQTAGKYYPLDNKWSGTRGKSDWVRVGFGPDDAYVTFGAYTIDCSKTEYSVDSVKLYYGAYKKANIAGKFSDKMLSHTTPEHANYPRFVSYKKDLSFDDVAPHVKVFGGLQLNGAKMNLDGTSDHKAMIKIYRFDGLVGIIAKSRHFDIQKDKEINAGQAEIKLVLGKDSIVHGGITMRYNIDKRELFLFRGKNGIQKSAYNDYYHGFEENPELIYWDMNEPELIMRNIAVGGK